jgi:hypothetical protein
MVTIADGKKKSLDCHCNTNFIHINQLLGEQHSDGQDLPNDRPAHRHRLLVSVVLRQGQDQVVHACERFVLRRVQAGGRCSSRRRVLHVGHPQIARALL